MIGGINPIAELMPEIMSMRDLMVLRIDQSSCGGGAVKAIVGYPDGYFTRHVMYSRQIADDAMASQNQEDQMRGAK